MKKTIIILLFICISWNRTYAEETVKEQEKKKETFVKFHGSIGLFYDIYTFKEDNYENFRAKYPDNLFRLNASASLSFGKYFTIPISINVTNQKVLFTYPQLPQGNIVDYIKNPKNNIHIAPKYKWIQAYFGTQTPMYSKLTTGDINVFGVGIDLNPKWFILSASHGISQIAIEPNANFNMEGAYQQKMTALRIGVGHINSSKFTLNAVKIKDEVNSIKEKPLYGNPIEGITVSALLETKFFKKIFLETETAASAFTNNLNNTDTINEPIIEKVQKIITINGTSQVGLSHISSLMWKSKGIMFGGEVKFVSASFVPVGYRNAERDFLDYKFKTNLQFFKNSTSVSGSFGVRTNNVQNTSVQSTRRIIGNFAVNTRITKRFSLNAAFSNFGFKDSNGLSQQGKIEITNNTFTLSPSYRFATKQMRHLLNLTASLVNYKQFDAGSLSYVETKSQNLNLVYGMFFKQLPLTIQFSGLYLQNKMPNTNLSIANLGTSVGYKFFQKKFLTKLSLNFVNVKKGNFTADNRITSNLKLGYKITKDINFAVTYRMNQYKYGSSKPDASTNEHRIQFALTTRF